MTKEQATQQAIIEAREHKAPMFIFNDKYSETPEAPYSYASEHAAKFLFAGQKPCAVVYP